MTLIELLQPGDVVTVVYSGYTVQAKVVEVEPEAEYGPQRGWVCVEQITDYEDRDERPMYLAAVEFIAREGEELPPSPFGSVVL